MPTLSPRAQIRGGRVRGRFAHLLVEAANRIRGGDAPNGEEPGLRMLEMSREAVAIHQDGRLVYINPAGARLVGAASPRELLGRSILDFVDDREKATERVGWVTSGEAVSIELVRLAALDGREVMVEIAALPWSHLGAPAVQMLLRDVTERTMAERALQDREEQLSSAFGGAAIGMAFVGLDGRYRQVNRAFSELTGYSPEQLRAMTWLDLTHPDEREETEAFVASVLAHGSGGGLEQRVMRVDGRPVWALVNTTLLRDEGGEPRCLFTQVLDISQRKEAEEALREHRLELSDLFTRLPVALYRSTPDGQVVAANPALQELLGYPSVDALLHDARVASTAHAHPEIREEWRRRIEAEGVVTDFEQEMVRHDGKRIWVRDNARVVRDAYGEVRYYEGAMVDVTEPRRAEQSRARLVRILEVTSDFVLLVDRAGRLIYANRAARGLLGLDDGDELPPVAARRLLGQPELLQEIRAGVLKSGTWSGELTFPTPEGRALAISALALAHVDDQHLRYVSVIGRDITERREAQLRLEELVRSKDEFVASVSHELRTPLTAVVGLAEELRAHQHQFTAAERGELVGLIAEQGAEVANIVEDLLVAARADIGKVVVCPEPISLDDEVAAVLRALPEEAQDKVSYLPAGETAWADGRRLRQVLRNLSTNALRYGGEGISVRVIPGTTQVAVEVADDGPGIPEDEWERIFEPYQRAHEVPSQPASVGLGLTVSRQLSRMMGGDLSYRYRDGWSVFCLSVPACTPKLVAIGADVPPAVL
ncbi:MAG: PAS domain S-box protein [Acidimicrobiia bacterium]